MIHHSLYLLLFSLIFFSCNASIESKPIKSISKIEEQEVEALIPLPAIYSTAAYLPLLQNKKIALVVNQTSELNGVHLVDTLFAEGINVKKIFAPEHGFRGIADAGEKVSNGKDKKTGLPLISLYGSHKKPFSQDLEGIELVLFDIQDVGARFYTYISTMSLVMEACAEAAIPFIVLDRPNPNGHYVDGFVTEQSFTSFVGMHPVPIVHGMTIGEYARMVNGEKWLKNAVKCDLTVIPCQDYNHQSVYDLPVKPSPNLPNLRSIYLYPSLCFFEGTVVNIGRGTDKQFQVYGAPFAEIGTYTYTPQPKVGSKYPKHEGKECKGFDLSEKSLEDLKKETQLNLDYLIEFYKAYPDKTSFFLKNNFIDKLAGTDKLRNAIIEGKSAAEIRSMWEEEVLQFKKIRSKYLLYP